MFGLYPLHLFRLIAYDFVEFGRNIRPADEIIQRKLPQRIIIVPIFAQFVDVSLGGLVLLALGRIEVRNRGGAVDETLPDRFIPLFGDAVSLRGDLTLAGLVVELDHFDHEILTTLRIVQFGLCPDYILP